MSLKSQKIFAAPGEGGYQGGSARPIIGIKDDNSIIRKGKFTDGKANSVSINKPTQTPVSLDFDKTPFHLGIEPWITSPLMSDTDEGIYIGTIKGETLTTTSGDIMLAVKLSIDYPETVIGLVKGKKIYLFKQSQLVNSIGSKVFSEVKSDEDFRDYAHNLMKSAHKDNYSEATTNKVVDDLLAKHSGSDYGELIGRLKSGLGNKSYSDSPLDCSYEFDPIPQNMAIDPNKDSWYSWECIIGTVIMSTAYAHLYHLCTGSYVEHEALKEYYNRMPAAVDRLAELYLSEKRIANFTNAIVPSKTATSYFTEIRGYLVRFKSRVTSDSPYTPQLDEVINIVSELLYKLTRLSTRTATFADISIANRYEGRDVDNMVKSTADAIKAYINKYRKSPVKEIGVKDSDHRIKQYVRSKMLNGKDMSELIDSLMRSLTAPLTNKMFR